MGEGVVSFCPFLPRVIPENEGILSLNRSVFIKTKSCSVDTALLCTLHPSPDFPGGRGALFWQLISQAYPSHITHTVHAALLTSAWSPGSLALSFVTVGHRLVTLPKQGVAF